MTAESDSAIETARAMMLKYGVSIQYVFPRDGVPEWPFAYTVGLTAHGHPELLVTGLSPEDSGQILNALAAQVSEGRTLTPGDVCVDVIGDDQVLIIAGPVDAAGYGFDYTIQIAREVFSDREVPLPLQVVYPDAAGRFPWDGESAHTSQQLLAPVPFHTAPAWQVWRTRAMHWLGQITPESWRWLHERYARWGGYFWLPCPLCERPFGGHEWREIDGQPCSIPTGEEGFGQGICPNCTRAGRGERISMVFDDDADERL